MSAAHHGSAERARRSGGGVSFLTADMALADGSLRAAHRLVADGASAVLVRALEVDREVLRRRAGEGAALQLSPDELVRLALDEITTKLPKGWDSRSGVPLEVASCAWVPVDGGIAVHGFHFLPLLLAPDLIGRPFGFDLLTVDTRFIRLALGERRPTGASRLWTMPAKSPWSARCAPARKRRRRRRCTRIGWPAGPPGGASILPTRAISSGASAAVRSTAPAGPMQRQDRAPPSARQSHR